MSSIGAHPRRSSRKKAVNPTDMWQPIQGSGQRFVESLDRQNPPRDAASPGSAGATYAPRMCLFGVFPARDRGVSYSGSYTPTESSLMGEPSSHEPCDVTPQVGEHIGVDKRARDEATMVTELTAMVTEPTEDTDRFATTAEAAEGIKTNNFETLLNEFKNPITINK